LQLLKIIEKNEWCVACFQKITKRIPVRPVIHARTKLRGKLLEIEITMTGRQGW